MAKRNAEKKNLIKEDPPYYKPKPDDRAYKSHLKAPWLMEFRKHGTIHATCAAIGVDHDTIIRWRKNDPEFKKAYEQTDAAVTEALERRAMAAAMAGNETLLIFLLKCRSKRYRPRTYHEINIRFVNEFVMTLSAVAREELADVCRHCGREIGMKTRYMGRLENEVKRREQIESFDVEEAG